MIEIRRSEDRGHTHLDWLDSRHSFSFGEFRDPRHMGFRRLRVINDDAVRAGAGFGMHPHQDMEILTFLQSGALAHRDSLGNAWLLRPGDVQRMTAGTGVTHSERNPCDSEAAQLLQVWIEPAMRGLEPSYEQRSFSDAWQLVVSRDAREESIKVHQDVDVFRGRLEAGAVRDHELAPGRHAWVQIVAGDVEIAGHRLKTGDAVAVSGESLVRIKSIASSDVLLFDLA